MRAFTAIAGVAAVAGAVALSGQSQRPAASLDDVVGEIRGLRADLKKSTRASTEMQLLTARLSLQEQRLAVLSNQRSDVSARLLTATSQRVEAERELQGFEENKTRNQDLLGIPRSQLDAMERETRSRFEVRRDAEQQLRSQEAQLNADIAAEQSRWQDFNARLDELERSLR
jgi:chromosome segregation ATPase